MSDAVATARDLARRMLDAALAAVEPEAAVAAVLDRRGEALRIGEQVVDLAAIDRVLVVGAGKASAPMARAVVAAVGVERIAEGLIVVKDGHGLDVPGVTVVEAAHPVPDERGAAAARRLMDLLDSAGERDLVIACWSGGASSLLPAPREGLGLADEIALTDHLLASGLDIQAMNAIRKHCSQCKGGGLARIAAPAAVHALLVSDVPGDDPAVIGSGLTAPDPSTFAEAWSACEEAGILDDLPAAVRALLERGRAGDEAETPGPDDPCFQRVHHCLVATNAHALDAAAGVARAAGLEPRVQPGWLTGSASARGRALVAAAGCVVAGGETTVQLGTDPGHGGRNQELALAAAAGLAAAAAPAVVLAAGTDGTDGPTDAAGGLVDPGTWTRIRDAGLDPEAALSGHDAYPALAAAGDLLVTGPTRTNVMDIAIRIAVDDL